MCDTRVNNFFISAQFISGEKHGRRKSTSSSS